MKFSNMLALVAVATAVLAGGCRYNKAVSNSTSNSGSEGSEIESGRDISSIESQESGDLASIGDKRFEDMYARCTDVDFTPVYFGFDSSVVPPGELGKVDAVARHLIDKPERVVVIEGNCDERGSNEYNMSLGQNRAIIVLNYLVNSGIDASRIQARSYGEENPAAEGHDEASWAKNRRDDFAIFDTSVRK